MAAVPLHKLKFDSTIVTLGFRGGSMVMNPPAHAGDAGLIWRLRRCPGEGNDNNSSILAWEIPWTEEPGWL